MVDRLSRQASLNSLIDDSVETRLKDLHTCTPGIIQSFDTQTKRAKIQPAITRVLVNGNLIAMPKLINCPLGIMRFNGFAITVPVKSGDECMIHFTERSLDAWIQFGDVRGPTDIRIHHESDAYFLPVHTSESNPLNSYDADNVVIRNDTNDQKITLFANGDITIDSPANATINTTGETTINSAGNCNINAPQIINNGSAAGVVTTLSINPITGTPFPDGSTTLLNSDG